MKPITRDRLTPTEYRVLRVFHARGQSLESGALQKTLGMGKRTLESHVCNIMGKCPPIDKKPVHTRAGMLYATRHLFDSNFRQVQS